MGKIWKRNDAQNVLTMYELELMCYSAAKWLWQKRFQEIRSLETFLTGRYLDSAEIECRFSFFHQHRLPSDNTWYETLISFQKTVIHLFLTSSNHMIYLKLAMAYWNPKRKNEFFSTISNLKKKFVRFTKLKLTLTVDERFHQSHSTLFEDCKQISAVKICNKEKSVQIRSVNDFWVFFGRLLITLIQIEMLFWMQTWQKLLIFP